MILKSNLFKLCAVSLSSLTLLTTSIGAIGANADNTTNDMSFNNTEQNRSVMSNDRLTAKVTSSNQKYKDAQQEISTLSTQNLNDNDKNSKIQQIINKYNGAEANISIVENNMNPLFVSKFATKDDVKEKFIDGGVNDFAYNKKGLNSLRTYYGGLEATAITGGGAATVWGGPITTFIGLAGGGLVSRRAGQAQTDVKSMISSNKHSGGCRMTVTEEFAIPSLYSEDEA
ncbi:hypothetical protein [Apilactobacillus timberlakei]|uniref:hypothetical protein n=1 Tax=Apilactobacillus timberlakei TaxID=2008380 RepID=UPI001128541D|nr:hypothetical protein [Apilactobacillus timberlakei]TPR16713.1 hypothetical protein DYZ95_06965 [Apilactobacillus timberlakei]TPR21575.1 hypothetical protein DY083_06015 [Apilactobacillus timberlakei]